MRQPIGGGGHFVVVVGIAFTEEAKEVLVDEIEVPETVDIAGRGMVADGMTLVRIGKTAEDVPGSGDCEVEKNSCERFELPPAAPLAAQHEQRDGGGEEKDWRDQPLGEGRQRERGPHDVEARGAA